jgi:hypothetical protein
VAYHKKEAEYHGSLYAVRLLPLLPHRIDFRFRGVEDRPCDGLELSHRAVGVGDKNVGGGFSGAGFPISFWGHRDTVVS